jgi:hypothetical protein
MTPERWRKLERKLGWIAVPNIAILIVTLQVLGVVAIRAVNPFFISILSLNPELVLQGQVWRLVTFMSLALPPTISLIWVFFTVWFSYYILNAIENEWGAFKTTLYVLTSVVAMIAFSFITGMVIEDVSHFESTLFLAAAALFPEMEVSLFFLFPVKLKWLGVMSGAMVLLEFMKVSNLERGLLLVVYSNFILFFSPLLMERYRQWKRKRDYRSKF